MIPMFDLNGHIAIVTGGNGGIGLGMARGLAMAGATVVVAGRNREKNAAAVRDLISHRTTVIALEVDVTQPEACQAMIASTMERFGQLDILINNAGINIRKPPQDYTLEEWNKVMNTNLTSAFVCCQAAYPALCRSGGGKIINIGSMTSIFGAAFAGPYGASKGGIVQLTKALASAWAKDSIQVNAVLPGWINTDLTKQAREQVPGLHQKILDRTPAGRWGEPGDLEGIAVFLASHASDFVTGTAIPVDGGYSAQA
jgi:2-deoxy-D-gluconate 3-dehydrogenase